MTAMRTGLTLGKLFGIEIYVDPSWIVVFLFVTWNLITGLFPNVGIWGDWSLALLASVFGSLLYFASILAHELAHSIVAQKRGIPIRRITLFIFGGMAHIEKEPDTPATEFLMTIVGPLTSVVLGVVFLILSGLFGSSILGLVGINGQWLFYQPTLSTLFVWLGIVNIMIGIFNMIPGFPLDGGRILRSILWSLSKNFKWATSVSSFLGEFVGYTFLTTGALMGIGVGVPIFGSGWTNGIWFGVMGWFLASAARQAYRQMVLAEMLEGVEVGELMRNEVTPLSPQLRISRVIDNYLIGSDNHVFPVVKNNRLKGLVRFEEIKKVSQKDWAKTFVSQVMIPRKDLKVLHPKEDASKALHKLLIQPIGQLPVVQNGQFLGILSKKDILLWLARRYKNTNVSLAGANI